MYACAGCSQCADLTELNAGHKWPNSYMISQHTRCYISLYYYAGIDRVVLQLKTAGDLSSIAVAAEYAHHMGNT